MTIHEYAAARGLSLRQARRQLIQLALAQLEARAEGGRRAGTRLSQAQRQDRARAAAQARWARAKGATAGPKGG